MLRHKRFDGSLSKKRQPIVGAAGARPCSGTVAGMLDKAEAPEETMRREILEETGYQTSSLQHVSTFYLTPGGSSERIFLYYGKVAADNRCEPGGGLVDENEDIGVLEMAVDEAFAAVDRGEIVDAKTLSPSCGSETVGSRLESRAALQYYS